MSKWSRTGVHILLACSRDTSYESWRHCCRDWAVMVTEWTALSTVYCHLNIDILPWCHYDHISWLWSVNFYALAYLQYCSSVLFSKMQIQAHYRLKCTQVLASWASWVSRTLRMCFVRAEWDGHVERSTGWIARVRERKILAQNAPGRPKLTWDE